MSFEGQNDQVLGGPPTMAQRDRARAKAKADDNTVIYGKPDLLQLDLDTISDYVYACAALVQFWTILNPSSVVRTISPGGNHHLHVALTDPMPLQSRIAWQAFLGSDRKREALNYAWSLEEAAFEDDEPFLIETDYAQRHNVKVSHLDLCATTIKGTFP